MPTSRLEAQQGKQLPRSEVLALSPPLPPGQAPSPLRSSMCVGGGGLDLQSLLPHPQLHSPLPHLQLSFHQEVMQAESRSFPSLFLPLC